MRVLFQKTFNLIWILAFVVSLVVVSPSVAWAQDQTGSKVVLDIAKSVLFDPTTYAPAVLGYTSQKMDWNSSQPLFRAGWVEHNALFTVSGRPDDRPISFEAGNQQIRHLALMQLQESMLNNLGAQVVERVLTQKHPEHQKLFKTLSWMERIGFSAYVGYLGSIQHFRQARRNEAIAQAQGLQ